MAFRSSDSRNPVTALLAFVLLAVLASPLAVAQLAPLREDLGAAGLGLALRRLPVTARVLVVTAHPDDEPSGVLVRLSRGLGVRTALVTLTRGEGGQNEIGSELGEALGVLRTEELSAVHRYDGVEQYFGRSYEFGFSYSVDETLEKWGKEDALSDVVRVVRAFRPDVILGLPTEGPGGGQHHQAAGQLAREAFRAAADPARFPEQLKRGLPTWQARKLYQGGFERLPGAAVGVKTGVHDPLLGMSWQELGSIARGSHRCQGSSSLKADPLSGEASYALLDSEPPMGGVETDVLDGIDTSLQRLGAAVPAEDTRLAFVAQDVEQLRVELDAVQAAYDPRDPGKAAAPLAAGLDLVRKLRAKLQKAPLAEAVRFDLLDRLAQKDREFQAALALAHGLAFEVVADDDEVTPGQTFGVVAKLWNQGSALVRIDELTLAVPEGWRAKRTQGDTRTLEPGKGLEIQFQVKLADKVRYAQPYWRRGLPNAWRYDLDNPAWETLPFAPPEVVASLRYSGSGGIGAALDEPALVRYEGRWVGGEKQKTVRSVPQISVGLSPEIAIFPLAGKGVKREFKVELTSGAREPVSASVKLEAPPGWLVEPAQAGVALRFEGEHSVVRFQVSPPAGVAEGEVALRAVAVTKEGEFREGFERIAYDHIQERNFYTAARARVKAIDVKVPTGVSVGYVMGAGDEVAGAIFQLGVPVTFVTEAGLSTGDLSRYTTIVTGIRAYQTRPDLRAFHPRLMKWVAEGGHLVVQYNKLDFNQLQERWSAGGFSGQRATSGKPPDSPWAPYPGASVGTNRVTDENAPITFLVPDHPLVTTPNRITTRDFEGWIQERGLYFLDVRDVRYKDLVAATDPYPNNPGEKRGMLVEAQVGKGTWTYVGLGLFRQAAAGIDGAYRILANLVARPRPKP